MAAVLVAGSAGGQIHLEQAVLYGGPGDQLGLGIAVESDVVFAIGWNYVTASGMHVRYDLPLAAPSWGQSQGYSSAADGVASAGGATWLAGWAYPPNCGANDGVGGTESKSAFYRYAADGTLLGCGSSNFFSYRGGEYFLADSRDPATGDLLVTGYGEEMGWGGGRALLARYQPDGTLLWKRRFATHFSAPYSHLGGTYTRIASGGYDLAWLGGYLYVAGYDRDGYYAYGVRGQGMLLKVDAAAEPTDPSPSVYASNLYPVWERVAGAGSHFSGVTTLGTGIFAAGYTYDGTCDGNDLLVERYDADGNLIWRTHPAAPGDAYLADIVAIGDRLFAVGYLDDACDGDRDVLILEIDPDDGAILDSVLWGGGLAERAWEAKTDGDDLFVVGETRSFTEGGNLSGQNDMFVLHYSVASGVADASGDAPPPIDLVLADLSQDDDAVTCSLTVASGTSGLEPKSVFQCHLDFDDEESEAAAGKGSSGCDSGDLPDGDLFDTYRLGTNGVCTTADISLSYRPGRNGGSCSGLPSLACGETESNANGDTDGFCDGVVDGAPAVQCVISMTGEIADVVAKRELECDPGECLTDVGSDGAFDVYAWWDAKLKSAQDQVPDTDDGRKPNSTDEAVLVTLTGETP